MPSFYLLLSDIADFWNPQIGRCVVRVQPEKQPVGDIHIRRLIATVGAGLKSIVQSKERAGLRHKPKL